MLGGNIGSLYLVTKWLESVDNLTLTRMEYLMISMATSFNRVGGLCMCSGPEIYELGIAT